MKFHRYLCLAGALWTGALASGQAVPPADHIVISDPRIFDLSDDGTIYQLSDGPISSATLALVHGPKGTLVGTATVTDQFQETWGPVTVTGKLAVKGTTPLSMKLSGSLSGKRLVITGTYNPQVTLMNVVVNLSTVKNPTTIFQWNDAFIPSYAASVGVSLHRMDVGKNDKGVIKSNHALAIPGNPAKIVATTDKQLKFSSSFEFKTSGVESFGTYSAIDDLFTPSAAKVNVGYGSIITPGALVTITSDNFFPRNL